MADLKTATNSIGLLLTLAGVWVAYRNSPVNFWQIDGGRADTDFAQIAKQTERKNRLIAVGIRLVIAGTLLQLLSNFIPAEGA